MNTKRIVRWSIVLLLLAALPGLTAALAQGETPAAQPALDANQLLSECNRTESEPNNTNTQADSLSLNDVICAQLEPAYIFGEYTCWGATDWFTFYLPSDQYVMLDARGLYIGDDNWGGDVVDLWLYREPYPPAVLVDVVQNWLLGPDDPVLMLDSLVAGNYILKVVYDGEMEACNQNYTLALSSPLLVSAAAGNLGTGNVAGIPFQAGDILAHSDLNNGEERWTMLFDASDVGLTRNVTSIAMGRENELQLTLAATQNVTGVGAVTAWDILNFDGGGHLDPGQYGNKTSGEFGLALDGSDQQFTTASEKLDALDYDIEGSGYWYDFLISTTGVATGEEWSNNMKADDEDVFGITEDWGGAFDWFWFFDVNGKNDGPNPGNVAGLAAEDVTAVAYNEATAQIYLTIQGSGRIAGHRVTQKDIFALNYPSYTWGGYVWRGAQHGWNYNIDAFEYGGQ